MLDQATERTVAVPPRAVRAAQSRVGFNHRELESTSTSTSTSPSPHRSNARSPSRDRSESRDGRTHSRVPLFRRAPLDPDVEKLPDDPHLEPSPPVRHPRPSRLGKLGRHFIGVRNEHSFKSPLVRPLKFLSQPHENYLLAFLGTFVAILGAGGISYSFKDVQGFEGDTPLAIGSLGATAVLLYVVPESPLSQPRNVIGGHMISALSGVIISQLFALNSRFSEPLAEDNTIVQQHSWYHLTPVAYALAVAIAVFGMQVTKTVHPPGGATALIASAHRTVNGRYTYLLDIFLAVSWMTLWSFFVNNLGRRKYPAYWWTPNPPPTPAPAPAPAPNPTPTSSTDEKIRPTTIADSSSSNRDEVDNSRSSRSQTRRTATTTTKLGNLDEEELAADGSSSGSSSSHHINNNNSSSPRTEIGRNNPSDHDADDNRDGYDDEENSFQSRGRPGPGQRGGSSTAAVPAAF